VGSVVSVVRVVKVFFCKSLLVPVADLVPRLFLSVTYIIILCVPATFYIAMVVKVRRLMISCPDSYLPIVHLLPVGIPGYDMRLVRVAAVQMCGQ